MKYYYDLHIHSCLSPCADDDMTPANIAGMAKVAGLDVIAVTDHNSVANVRAVIKASKDIDGPLVIPGMEMETSDSIHIVILFEKIEKAEEFEKLIWTDCFKIKNRQDIYGRQLILDYKDEITGEKEDLLLVATNIGVYSVAKIAAEFGGTAIYAHADREAHGAYKILGGLDALAGIKSAEISKAGDEETLKYLKENQFTVIYNSDAHRLWEISGKEEKNYLKLDRLSIKDVLAALK